MSDPSRLSEPPESGLDGWLESPPPELDLSAVVPGLPTDQRRLPLSALAPDLSGACNMACRYCAEHASQPSRHSMTPEVLESILQWVQAESRDDFAPAIRLGSGEPLLNRPLIRRLRERTRELEPAPMVFLTTNGTLIDDELADWLAETGWRLKISLDGPAEIHDRWRRLGDGRGSFAASSAALDRLLARCREKVSVTAVLARGTDPAEVFWSLAERGVPRIELVPAVHHDVEIMPDARDAVRYASFLRGWCARALERGFGELPMLIRFEERLRRVMGYGNTTIDCGAGRNFFGVSSDGGVYPCFRFFGLERFRLGDLSDRPAGELLNAFWRGAGRPYPHRGACRDCWAGPLCAGPCFANAAIFSSEPNEPIPLHCRYERIDARYAYELVCLMRQRDPAELVSLLPGVEAWL